MVHGWNFEFESDMQTILASKPSNQSAGLSSLNDMLKGFFEFYSTFEYNDQLVIISTSKGEVVTGETALSKVTALFNTQNHFVAVWCRSQLLSAGLDGFIVLVAAIQEAKFLFGILN